MHKKKEKPLSRKQTEKLMKKKIVRDPDDLGPTQVASMIGETYQRARNLMLMKKMGAPRYDEDSRKLSVKRSGVLAYLEATGK